MRRSGGRSGTTGRTWFAAFSARVGLCLAALALLAQSFAIAAPPAPNRDAGSAAAELSALIGPGVVVCAEADQPGAPPAHHDDRCDLCPLCRLVADAAALVLPDLATLDAGAPAFAAELSPAPPPLRLPRRPSSFALARGPPSAT